ncbi:MAG: hypothetical protein HC850_10035 [Rhodomicrobium sp.]|nr:hypothetical protein [Rhodomicrobium sp.]
MAMIAFGQSLSSHVRAFLAFELHEGFVHPDIEANALGCIACAARGERRKACSSAHRKKRSVEHLSHHTLHESIGASALTRGRATFRQRRIH